MQLLKNTRSFLAKIYHYSKDEAELLISPPDDMVLEEHTGNITPGALTRICLFASFDIKSKVNDYTLHYIECLHEAGFEVIFCTTSGHLKKDDVEKLAPYCSKILRKTNVGFDFSSWNAARVYIKNKEQYEMLLLANDSVYGPIFNLKSLFNRAIDQGEKKKFYGLMLSKEIGPHLPSYFLIFGKNFLNSPDFEQYWKRYKPFSRKERIIRTLEVAGGSFCLLRGIDLVPLFDTNNLQNESSVVSAEEEILLAHNPSLLKWKPLITERGFPFIKTELLKQNRFRLKNIEEWKEVVESGDYPALKGKIEQHLSHLGIS